MSVYAQGRADALSSLGLTKVAISTLRPSPSMLKRFGGWLRKKAPTKTGVRDFFIGDPRRFGREIAKGHPLGKGSLVRESFHAPDMLSKVMFYGMPAVETAGIAMDDEGDKARRIGGSLGGAALGLAAYRPLGMVGSIAADAVGRSLGGGIGQTAKHLAGKAQNSISGPTPQAPPTAPPKLDLGYTQQPTYNYR